MPWAESCRRSDSSGKGSSAEYLHERTHWGGSHPFANTGGDVQFRFMLACFAAGLDPAPALEGPAEGYLIGIFEVSAHR